MKKRYIFLGLLIFIAFALAGCGSNQGQPGTEVEQVKLTISAAASLQDAAAELKDIYQEEHSGVDITYNFASSGTLQKQIEEGAPADLFISAGKKQMDALADKGLIIESSRVTLLSNELVLIAGQDSGLTGFDDLTGDGVKQISIGTPETVPAGSYAKEALINLKLWDQIQPKLVPAKDVRQVLQYVETGNVDAGMVYRSDAMAGQKIKVIASAPEDSHKPIEYPMAVIKSTKHQKETEDFAAFLQSDEAAKVFDNYGFTAK
ncbi:molybdate transport system substrate-binding protein [Desulfotomaculum arcticum]|uniref:Molybdate transport system substrate-binding protein n=1 Tax=Desulfotruncus arcticus DSM 17038 TaxID=1121424 RepID=A0A1I2XE78_9FIRM|nr:molybdate ABC transporter substrate-binding protein [Desulfotruncus arcticus]SFH10341.1 molybdate transport system substrate-binding protein [Desulfotomaculum arcticum] [Desulfotruncus arcticus DSM 17038]